MDKMIEYHADGTITLWWGEETQPLPAGLDNPTIDSIAAQFYGVSQSTFVAWAKAAFAWFKIS